MSPDRDPLLRPIGRPVFGAFGAGPFSTARAAAAATAVVSAGAGFSGATGTPDPQGDDTHWAYATTVVANWAVPMFRDATGTFLVGVVADHGSGIEKVEFILDGGAAVAVAERTTDPTTQLPGYWVRVSESTADSESREMRAVVYPVSGVVTVLQGDPRTAWSNGYCSYKFATNFQGTLTSLTVHVSPSGSDANSGADADHPLLTLYAAVKALRYSSTKVDGGTIVCAAGDYTYGTYAFHGSLPTNTFRWLTIRPSAGLADGAVRITGYSGTNGLGIDNVRLQDLTLQAVSTSNTSSLVIAQGSRNAWLWLEDCVVDNHSRTNVMSTGVWASFARVHLTGCAFTNCYDLSSTSTVLLNLCTFSYISADCCSGAGIAANCTLDNLDADGTGSHADIYQFNVGGGHYNRFLYALAATDEINCQGLFAGTAVTVRDVAIWNCDIQRKGGSSWRNLSFGGNTGNILIRDCDLSDNWLTDGSYANVGGKVLIQSTLKAGVAGQVTSSDAAAYAAAGSPAFPWTSPLGVRYET